MSQNSHKILLIGNPNCGKTTIFNLLCSMNAKVGNYSGVTVEKKIGTFKCNNKKFTVEDLPGVYSLSAATQEQIVAKQSINGGDFDLILNVVDASNFERNMFLTAQLAEKKLPMVVVLNMTDVLQKEGKYIDTAGLSTALGVPVTTCIGYQKDSIQKLKSFTEKTVKSCTLPHFPWDNLGDNFLSKKIKEASEILKETLPEDMKKSANWIAVRILENDTSVIDSIAEKSPEILKIIDNIRADFEENIDERPETLLAATRYKIINDLYMPFVKTKAQQKANTTKILDSIFLNKFIGIPLFFALMYAVFELVFAAGDPLMGYLEDFFGFIAEMIDLAWDSDNALKDFIIDGLIGGVGGVFSFLPNIVLLFLCLSILEDSGYMARAAFLCDRVMKRFGINGASIIPMLVGFGCSVPAIIGTRTLKSKAERFATIMVIPFFSCGARLPIYTLLIPIFFVKNQGLVMFGLYIFGMATAMISARILRSTIFRGESSAFLIELPPYRLPRVYNIFIQVKTRAWDFIKKAGTVILFFTIILWFVSTYPKNLDATNNYEATIAQIDDNKSLSNEDRDDAKSQAVSTYINEKFDYTYMGSLGNTLQPIFAPLGFDSKIVSAVLATLAAKEAFVAQIGIIYGIEDAQEDDQSLRDKIGNEYSVFQGLSILLFVLLSTPCVATIATSYTETKSFLFAASQFVGLAGIAYFVSLVFYQVSTNLF